MPTKLSGADIQYKAIFSSTKGLGILLHNFHCKEVGLILNVLVCFSNSYVSEIDQQLLLKVNTVEIFFDFGTSYEREDMRYFNMQNINIRPVSCYQHKK